MSGETLPSVTVTGQRLPTLEENESSYFRDFWSQFVGSLGSQESSSGPDQAFAPPEPVLLPEVIVTTAPRVVPSILTGIGAGLGALLFPTPTAPPALDEAPTPPGLPPPPNIPTTFEDFQPPNWWELIEEPYRPYPKPRNLGNEFDRLLRNLGRNLDELTRPSYSEPTLLPEVLVTPPAVTTRSTPDVRPGTPVDFFFSPDYSLPSGTPYDFPTTTNAPDTGPGSAPAPIGTPGIDPFPGDPLFDPLAKPRTGAAPGPRVSPSPDLFGDPLPDIFGNPFGDPITAPTQPTSPRTGTGGPGTTGGPSYFADPVNPTARDPLEDPTLTQFQPQPFKPNADVCQCDKPKPKQKQRQMRVQCFKGTYVQRTQGITFIPKEEVPCEKKPSSSVSKRETDPFGRPVPKKRRKGKSNNWKDIIDQVFPKP